MEYRYASFRSKSIIAQNNLSKLALMIKEKIDIRIKIVMKIYN